MLPKVADSVLVRTALHVRDEWGTSYSMLWEVPKHFYYFRTMSVCLSFCLSVLVTFSTNRVDGVPHRFCWLGVLSCLVVDSGSFQALAPSSGLLWLLHACDDTKTLAGMHADTCIQAQPLKTTTTTTKRSLFYVCYKGEEFSRDSSDQKCFVVKKSH